MVLVRLLSDDKERQFTLNIPSSYFEWLSHQEDKIYREIGKTQSMSLSFTKEFLYKELIESILLKRLEYTLTHIAQLLPSNSLKFNHPIFQEALSGALQILT